MPENSRTQAKKQSITRALQAASFNVLLQAIRKTEALEKLSLEIQFPCQRRTTIVLGSGASCTFGLPSMSDLAKAVARMPELQKRKNTMRFAHKQLQPGVNLEKEINDARLPPDIMEKIPKGNFSDQVKQQLNGLFNYGFDVLCKLFLLELSLDVKFFSDPSSSKAAVNSAAPHTPQSAEIDAAFKSATPESSLLTFIASNKYASRLSELLKCTDSDSCAKPRAMLSAFRDDFTFIHSSNRDLNGKIVFGRFWGLNGLSMFF